MVGLGAHNGTKHKQKPMNEKRAAALDNSASARGGDGRLLISVETISPRTGSAARGHSAPQWACHYTADTPIVNPHTAPGQ